MNAKLWTMLIMIVFLALSGITCDGGKDSGSDSGMNDPGGSWDTATWDNAVWGR
ncbi:MAG TPA: hypothetical protein P5346_07170 [Spirochaetota bacterium]|nr:hypothetical protein [Spirochaetota bacterium]